jgi:hypothetical protein
LRSANVRMQSCRHANKYRPARRLQTVRRARRAIEAGFG